MPITFSNFTKPNPSFPIFVAKKDKTGMFDESFEGADILVNAASVDGLAPSMWRGIAGALNKKVSTTPEGKQWLEEDWQKGVHQAGLARIIKDEHGKIVQIPLDNKNDEKAFVIHAYSPKNTESDLDKMLFKAYYVSLLRAKEIVDVDGESKVVAMPPLGIGVYQVDPKKSAEMAAKAMQTFYDKYPDYQEKLHIKIPIYDNENDLIFRDALNEELLKPKIELPENLNMILLEQEQELAKMKQKKAVLDDNKTMRMSEQKPKKNDQSGFDLYVQHIKKLQNSKIASVVAGATKKGTKKLTIHKKENKENEEHEIPSIKILDKNDRISIKSATKEPDKTDIELMIDSIVASGDKNPSIDTGRPEDVKVLYEGLVAKGLRPVLSDVVQQRFKDENKELPTIQKESNLGTTIQPTSQKVEEISKTELKQPPKGKFQ